MKNLLWIIWGVCLIGLSACKNDPPSKKNIEVKTRDYSPPAFNKDSAYAYVEAQVNFGSRVPGSEAHQQCADYLKEKLESFGLKARQELFKATRFDGLPMNGINIFGQLNPEAKKRIFIAAHWDSRFQADHDKDRPKDPILGADDGASGVGVCLEIARILSNEEDFKMGLDVVFFDLEDQGDDKGDNPESWGIGAQKWSNKAKANYNPKYGILLDMVGAKNAKYYQEGYSVQTAPNVVYNVWRIADQLGYGHVFLKQEGRGVVDDHYFVNQNTGWPMIDIIHTDNVGDNGFSDHWHTHDDDMDVIDRNMLGIVGKVVTTTLVYEDLNKL